MTKQTVPIDTKNRAAVFLFSQIPENEIEQMVNARVNRQMQSMTVIDKKNPFGSQWGELTAKMAAQKLGVSVADVKNQLNTTRATKAKTEQGLAGAVLRRKMRDEAKKDGLKIAREEKFGEQLKTWRLRAKELGCNNSQAIDVANCMTEIVASQAEFGAMVNLSSLLTQIASAAAGRGLVRLNALRCPPQMDTEEKGIVINPLMKFQERMANGKLGEINHGVILDEIRNIRSVFEKWNIPNETVITLVDVDAFIQDAENLTDGVDCFRKNLENAIGQEGGIRVEKVTERLGLCGIDCFKAMSEVQEIEKQPEKRFGERHVERVVDDCFEKLQPRKLPDRMKTRQAARDFASKSLAVEFILGNRLGAEDENVFLQRSKTSSAADAFLAGAKEIKKKPPFLFFWVERIVEVG